MPREYFLLLSTFLISPAVAMPNHAMAAEAPGIADPVRRASADIETPGQAGRKYAGARTGRGAGARSVGKARRFTITVSRRYDAANVRQNRRLREVDRGGVDLDRRARLGEQRRTGKTDRDRLVTRIDPPEAPADGSLCRRRANSTRRSRLNPPPAKRWGGKVRHHALRSDCRG